MAKKLVADLMVDYLERRDVKYIFGLCGHTVIGMLDALSRSTKIKYISNRHESVASTAADGYARLTHKASVVMCHLGPGLTNVLTGVANAAFDSIPMVVIAGDVPSFYFGKHPHQEVNMHGDATQYRILEPVVKRAWRIDDPESLPDIMDKAFRLGSGGSHLGQNLPRQQLHLPPCHGSRCCGCHGQVPAGGKSPGASRRRRYSPGPGIEGTG